MQDNLISINKIRVLLAVSDGEIDPEFSLKNLYLDDVPVESSGGAINYPGVKAEFRPGTQYRDHIKGFTDTASEITLGRDITTTTPYVIAVTNKTLDAIRINQEAGLKMMEIRSALALNMRLILLLMVVRILNTLISLKVKQQAAMTEADALIYQALIPKFCSEYAGSQQTANLAILLMV
ncbi:tail protein [Salmonella virus STSR3]|nr:tail protein [Salmonella virus STSR3]